MANDQAVDQPQQQVRPPDQRQPAKAEPEEPKPGPARKILRTVAVLAVLGLAAFLIWKFFLARPALPPNIVPVSGRVEGDESAVAPKTAGRLLEINFREGDRVNAGDIIARLDDEQIRARESQAEAQVTQAESAVRASQQAISVLQEQLKQSELETGQSRLESQGRVTQAQAELAAAEAELARQQASFEMAEFDRRAYEKLAKTGAASERQAREAATNAATQAAAVAAARRRVEASRGAVTSSQGALANPDIRTSQGLAVNRQIIQARAQLAGIQADAARAHAMLEEARANRADLVVRAPFTGVIATRAAEPGEVVIAGTPIVTLVDLNKVYLRGFVPEGQIGRVRLDQPARVYLDSDPQRPLDAWVSRVDPQATFTPENTYFREDRVKQVIGVKLQLKNPAGFAKPGMPADGEILVDGTTWPTSGRAVK